jgi:hypothetical protein
MKRNHDGDIKGFTQLSRAWYGKAGLDIDTIDRVTFGYYSPQGEGTSGEISVRWTWLNNEVIPEIKIYSDAWSALSNFHDLIDLLGKHDNEDPSPDKFCEYLKECGFTDLTEEKYV